MDAGEAATLRTSVESLVVVHNVAKRHNVGTMARSATAFGVSEIVLVGRRDFNAFGSHGSTSHLGFRHFHSLSQARHYLKALSHKPSSQSRVSISQIIEDFSVMWGSRGVCAAFRESQHTHLSLVSFWVGSKWEPSHQRRSFQLRESRSQKENKKNEAVDRPSLNREGNKFTVAEKPIKQIRRNYCAGSVESIVEERKNRKQSASIDIFEENGTNDSKLTSLLEALFDN
ncbi:hypothetical protein B296_00000907 [Ensete ventricosum]|uniref:tRNA/rRNA methyltransferase SpoU type domain-containing protein n=1 Tax=Ensete ventricosum TaxID=4639 RepID=A0A427AL85_ENSVE|nr:hypothetical protein B296_00000907 [Ensete ventricosum]